MARRPSTAGARMLAYQWRPSPVSVMCVQARPAGMRWRSSSAVMVVVGDGSVADFLAGAQQLHGQCSHGQPGCAEDGQTEPGRNEALAKKAVTKAVDHVEKRVQVADRLPERRPRLYRIEHAGQNGHRHDDEVLESHPPVELVPPPP